MAKQDSKIAIFGATGHIGKNLSYYFSQDKKNDLIVFSRNKKKAQKIMKVVIPEGKYSILSYDEFENKNYKAIINCIGMGNPSLILKNNNILEMTEFYDNKILEYIKKKKSTIYINFSSGAIYGQNFKFPVTESTLASLDINKFNKGSVYSISKLYSEIKHRTMKDVKIVDLRIFNFFSRFIDLKADFLMSQISNAIIKNKKFGTDKNNIIRDYIHPEDLFMIIKKCMNERKINTSFDIQSKKPIKKFDLLESLSKNYGLRYTIERENQTSPTGLKENYYSKSRKIKKLKITPKYSSLQTILMELKFLIN